MNCCAPSLCGRVLLVLLLAMPAAGQECWKAVEGGVTPGFVNQAVAGTLWDPDGSGPEPARLVVAVESNSFQRAPRVLRWTGTRWEPLGAMFSGTMSLTLASWDPDGDGPEPPRLIAAGSFTSVDGVAANRIAVWDGAAWQPMGGGLPSQVRTLTAWDPDGPGPLPTWLIAGGDFGVRRWDGQAWTAIPGPTGVVRAATVWDPDGDGPLTEQLVIGGSTGGVGQGVARYDGVSWHALGAGLPNRPVHALTTWRPEGRGPLPALLIAGGQFYFDALPGMPAAVAAWDGEEWSPMGGGLSSFLNNRSVYALATFDPDGDGPLGPVLVAGGDINVIREGVRLQGVARWDGEAWRPVDGGLAGGTLLGTSPVVRSLVAWAGDEPGVDFPGVVALGNFDRAGDLTAGNIAAWSLEGWRTLGRGFGLRTSGGGFMPGSVTAMVAWDHDADPQTAPIIVSTGSFDTVESARAGHLARWNGATWEPMEPGLTSPGRALLAASIDADEPGQERLLAAIDYAVVRLGEDGWEQLGGGFDAIIHALAMWDADGDGPEPARLIAAGNFTSVGGVPARRIAVWDGQSWGPLGGDADAGGLSADVERLVTWDPGEGPAARRLIAAGRFTAVGDAPAGRLAQWDGTSWSPFGGVGLDTRATAVAVWENGDRHLLVVSGPFTHAGGVAARGLAAWDGHQWTNLGNLTGVFGSLALALVPWDPDGDGPAPASLVALGNFTGIGSLAALGIARWDGTRWFPVTDRDLRSGTSVLAVPPPAGTGKPARLLVPMSLHLNQTNLPQLGWIHGVGVDLPTIVEHPDDVTVPAGEDATFSVLASAGPAAAYRWRRDGVDLFDGPAPGGGVISGAGNATLSLSGVRLVDRGLYSAAVSEPCGAAVTAAARLAVVCSADWNSDGVVNSTDLTAFLTVWLASVGGGDLTGDFNGDGETNSADIHDFLGAWLGALTGGC